MSLDGVDTGFELYIDLSAGIGDLPEGLPPTWTHSCASRTGADVREALAATIFLRAFAECTGGGYWYPDDQLYYAPESVASYLDDQIAGLKHLLSRKKR